MVTKFLNVYNYTQSWLRRPWCAFPLLRDRYNHNLRCTCSHTLHIRLGVYQANFPTFKLGRSIALKWPSGCEVCHSVDFPRFWYDISQNFEALIKTLILPSWLRRSRGCSSCQIFCKHHIACGNVEEIAKRYAGPDGYLRPITKLYLIHLGDFESTGPPENSIPPVNSYSRSIPRHQVSRCPITGITSTHDPF